MDQATTSMFNRHPLTDHAADRMQRRGVAGDSVALVLAHADRRVAAGSGAVALSITRRQRQNLCERGLAPALLDRTAGLILLLSRETGAVITVMHDQGPAARRYRRAS